MANEQNNQVKKVEKLTKEDLVKMKENEIVDKVMSKILEIK